MRILCLDWELVFCVQSWGVPGFGAIRGVAKMVGARHGERLGLPPAMAGPRLANRKPGGNATQQITSK